MLKTWFCFFLTLHIIGDFYLQSAELASKKRKELKSLFLHSLFYLATFIVGILPFYSLPLLIVALVLAITHFIIDLVKHNYVKKKRDTSQVYLIDQGAHLFLLAVASIVLASISQDLTLLKPVVDFLNKTGINYPQVLSALALILFISKPINITIKQLLEKYRPKEDKNYGIKNAGASIGILERYIIVLLIGIGQYSTIGLVLTAKSVARYNRISEDKQFAEYYLLGTLLSTLIAIVAYFLYF